MLIARLSASFRDESSLPPRRRAANSNASPKPQETHGQIPNSAAKLLSAGPATVQRAAGPEMSDMVRTIEERKAAQTAAWRCPRVVEIGRHLARDSVDLLGSILLACRDARHIAGTSGH